MAMDPTERRSRRALLASAVGGAAALAATQLAKPLSAAAADPNDVALNQDNSSTALTSISQATADTGGFKATASGIGTAIEGSSPAGIGVRGSVTGAAVTFAGVIGTSGDLSGSALEGASLIEPLDAGVYGYAAQSEISTGIWGEAPASGLSGVYGSGPTGVYGSGGTGVEGDGEWGVAGFGDPDVPTSIGGLFVGEGRGVVGISDQRTGVHAHVGTGTPPATLGTTALFGSVSATNQVGLEARGRIRFPNRSGKVKMRKGRYYQDFPVGGMSSTNSAYATLATYRSGRWVAAVVCYTGKIRIYLNTKLTADTYVNWIVLG